LLDDSVAVGMDKAVQVLVNQCEFLLISLQLQTDYNPTGKDTVFDFKPTKACEEVCKCLDTHTKVLTGCIEKGTMEVFQSEVAARLFQYLKCNLGLLSKTFVDFRSVKLEPCN
jgi:recyclin-1